MNGFTLGYRFWLVLGLAWLNGACAAVSSAQAADAAPEAKDPAASAIRIVNCDEKVQSRKRGICVNAMSEADFRAIAPGVSWYYNWGAKPLATKPADAAIEYIPMAWNHEEGFLTSIEAYLAAGNKPRCIFAINEPNLKGQAFITPEQTAAAYAKVKAIADKYGIPVVGPHMALGSAPKDSIKAMDPIEKKELTYTFMVPFLKAFFHYAEQSKTEVGALATHTYGNIGELKWAVGMMNKEFDRPVWLTEYNQWNTPNEQAALTYLIQSSDFLERTPYVQGYAWFKERLGDSKNSLLDKESGKLTVMGEAYVALPVHDADVYYRLPGQLPAENYVAIDKMEIWPTTDSDGGFAHMASTDADGWIDYNVQVDEAGTYTMRVRVNGPAGKFEVLKGDAMLGSASTNPVADNAWQTVETSIELPAGAQTLRIRCQNKGQGINWIEFAKR